MAHGVQHPLRVFLLVLIGVLGGLRAFGLVGLFAGPMVLAVLLAVWRQWLEQHADTPGSQGGSGNPGSSPAGAPLTG